MNKSTRAVIVSVLAGSVLLGASGCGASAAPKAMDSPARATSESSATATPSATPEASTAPSVEPSVESTKPAEEPAVVEVEPTVEAPVPDPVVAPSPVHSFAEPAVPQAPPVTPIPLLIPPTGEFAPLFESRVVKAGSTEPVQFGLRIEGGAFRTHEVKWEGGEAVGATVERMTAFDYTAHKEAWLGTVTPGPQGFVAGTAIITATMSGTATGAVIESKSFTLTVQ